MGNLFSNIVSYFSNKRILFVGILSLITVILLIGISKLNINEDVFSILPKNENYKHYNEVIKKNNLNKQIIFSINPKSDDTEEVYDELCILKEELSKKTKGLISEIEIEKNIDEKLFIDNFFTNFPSTLTYKDYNFFESKIKTDSIKKNLNSVNKRLSSNTFFISQFLTKDPLGLSWNKLKAINPQSNNSNYEIEDDILFFKDKKRVLFFSHLKFDLNDNKKNTALNETLEKFKIDINSKYKKLHFDYFGTFQITYANSKQIKKDTNLTLTISISLILGLLLFYYRSIKIPVFFILPAIFGALTSLGLLGYFHPNISAISIATSSVLLGIVVDYSFHFFTHYKHTGNLIESVQEISYPLFIGSFTTIAAFASLLFTNSLILQDFGLIALITLIGAAIFTLIGLPVLLDIFKIKFEIEKEKDSKIKYPKWVLKTSLLAIICITIVCLFFINDSKFDSDINNLSYHTEDLIRKEKYYTGINPTKQKKLFIISSDKNFDKALDRAQFLLDKIENYKSNHPKVLHEVVSISTYIKSDKHIQKGNRYWGSFWKNKQTRVIETLNNESKKYDFSSDAFNPFNDWISNKNNLTFNERKKLISQIGLNNLIYTNNNRTDIITSVVIDRTQLNHFKKYIHNSSKTDFVFDISDFAQKLLNSVKIDFNYLLTVSSIIVFITLLLLYGRIELALLNFLPMVIAWIWILGFSAFFNLKFNFVNIIISTFIFGLGDDFTIFITDGLLQKYKYNKSILDSYKKAILLSALTTIFGIGVLYFAKHPSIHSIALLSVIGIVCTIIVTLIIQPAIFNFFVQNRINKKKSPVTFFILLYSILLYLYFLLGCIILNIILIFSFLIPVKKKIKRLFFNFLIQKMAKSVLFVGLHIKKQIINPKKLDFSKPKILISNHTSFLDILLILQLHPKTIIMVKKWVYNSPFFGLMVRYLGYICVENNDGININIVKDRINDGYSLAIFPEGTRSIDGKLNRFHKGAFHLAKELDIPIQTISIIGSHEVNSKNDILMKSGSLILKVGEVYSSEHPIMQERLGKITKYFSSIINEEIANTKHEYFKSDILKHRILYNFIFKNPITEWYIRIKIKFEAKNFEYYDQLIDDRLTIYDIGCGYGYLSYYLHYRNAARKIIGIDYDEEKIQLAKNGFDKNENLSFVNLDLREIKFENSDVIFFNDVLHYLTPDEQIEVLAKACNSINQNGILIIRDGITDLHDRHLTTTKTEKYSTRIFKFNKISNQLSFFSSKDIFSFAEKMNFNCEMIEQSKKTSNVLFILKNNHGDKK